VSGQLALGDKGLTGTASVARDEAATRRAWWRQTGRSLLIVGACAAWWNCYSGTTGAVVYVDERGTRVWPAGRPQEPEPCVVSVPGGAKPIGVAMSTTDNRRS
jgi:hypothetical protein